jgi:hypothetical protein
VNDNKCGISPFISHTLITDFPMVSKNGRILTLLEVRERREMELPDGT